MEEHLVLRAALYKSEGSLLLAFDVLGSLLKLLKAGESLQYAFSALGLSNSFVDLLDKGKAELVHEELDHKMFPKCYKLLEIVPERYDYVHMDDPSSSRRPDHDLTVIGLTIHFTVLQEWIYGPDPDDPCCE